MVKEVDQYISDGCMRCKYGATPKCKVNNWRTELIALRAIALQTGLKEEIKWGVPVYTLNGKNIISIVALKESATFGFFKGVLIKDQYKILQQQGTIQSSRIIRIKNINEIEALKVILYEYIFEAIDLEKKGIKVSMNMNQEPIPEELILLFEEEPEFRKAFFALTPGRQRGYIIYFSQTKQAQTRIMRIQKYKKQIFEGVGLHDKGK